MAAPVFIGDEVTAAGYRLAGARIVVPERGGTASSFNDALQSAEFVLLTEPCAADIPRSRLDLAIRRASPPVFVVPDAAGLGETPGLVAEVDRALGIEQ